MTTWVVIRAFLVATILSAALAPAIRRTLVTHHIVDVPNERSLHSRPTPRGAGIAVALAATVALVGAVNLQTVAAVAGSAGLYGVVGLIDDTRGLRPTTRLVAQIMIPAMILPVILRGMALGQSWTWVFGIGVVVWSAAYVNAFNFMDGINGMAVAQTAVGGAGFALMGVRWSSMAVVLLGVTIAGSAVGFAPYNVPVARLFLGDVGSYFIGGWLAATTVVALRAGIPPEVVVSPFLLYLVDTGSTLWRRWRRRESLLTAHHEHAYQRLIECGWTHTNASIVAASAMAICTVSSLATGKLPLAARIPATSIALTIACIYAALPSLVQNSRARIALRLS